MKLFIWINEKDLKTFNEMLISHTTEGSIKVCSKMPNSWERYFQVQIEYDTYINLIDNNKIYIND